MSEEQVVEDFEVSKKIKIIHKTSNITSIDVGETKVSIEDNFLPEDELRYLQKRYCLSSQIPWYWSNFKIRATDDVNDSELYSLNDYQLVHTFFNATVSPIDHSPAYQSPQLKDMLCILERLPMYALLRLKLNLNPRTETHWFSGFHTDSRLSCTTSIFYLNTCNGATVFEEGGEIESVENRLVTFPSNLRHASKSTTNVKSRYVLNINYFPLTEENFTYGTNEERLVDRLVRTDPKFLE